MTKTMDMRFRHLYPNPPDSAAGYDPITGHPVMVTRGELGYTALATGFDVDNYNALTYVTPAIAKKMFQDAKVLD